MRQVSPLETSKKAPELEFNYKKTFQTGFGNRSMTRITAYHFQCRDGSKVWSSSIALGGGDEKN